VTAAVSESLPNPQIDAANALRAPRRENRGEKKRKKKMRQYQYLDDGYGVAATSRLLKIICFFCKRAQ